MKNTVRFALILLLLLVPVVGVFAFWSYGLFIHQDITKEALNGGYRFSLSGEQNTFDAKAITAINSQHQKVDAPFGSYFADEHFDSESLIDSYKLLLLRRLQLKYALEESPPNQQSAWAILGQMLHSVQDF